MSAIKNTGNLDLIHTKKKNKIDIHINFSLLKNAFLTFTKSGTFNT